MDGLASEGGGFKVGFRGFVRVMENLESRGILKNHFPGLESCGFFYLVMEKTSLAHGK